MAQVIYDTDVALSRPVLPRISLRAVFSGIVVALIAQVMLMLLGAAIGFSALGADPDADTAQGVGIGALIWLVLSLCVSSFLGGWVSAAVARAALKRDGVFHGLVTWASVALIGLFLVSGTLTGLVSGALGLGKSAASTVAESAAQSPELRTQMEANQPAAQAEVQERVEQARQAIQDPANQEQAAKG